MYIKSEDQMTLRWAKKMLAINLLGGACSRCFEKNPLVLEFHHLRDKNFDINTLRNYRWSTIDKEITKCILLCGNCHSEEHNVDGRGIKEALLKMKGIFACEQCGYDNKAALVFHHNRGIKQFKMSSIVTKHVHFDEAINEIIKCSVLCRNCHMLTHCNHERFERLLPLIKKKMLSYKESANIDRDYVRYLFKSGVKKAEIARIVGCSKSAISSII